MSLDIQGNYIQRSRYWYMEFRIAGSEGFETMPLSLWITFRKAVEPGRRFQNGDRPIVGRATA
jgi:hypothetical protein